MYAVTQRIEIAQASERLLWMSFLDMQGVYDNVNREILWTRLEESGLSMEFVRSLTKEYTLTWEPETTVPAAIRWGFKRECPVTFSFHNIFGMNGDTGQMCTICKM